MLLQRLHPQLVVMARSTSESRFLRLLRPKRVLAALAVIAVWWFYQPISVVNSNDRAWHRAAGNDCPPSARLNASSAKSYAHFDPPEPVVSRASDVLDTFALYKYRSSCNVSSLDLHAPFAPLCTDRRSLLAAMSSGGRIGLDAPFMPRGCDMRWFSSEEICEILSRFERVIILGDSMMRHVLGSINVLIRKDLGFGAVTDWNFSLQERKDCFCNEQFDVKACSIQGIYKTSDVIKNDPESLACPADKVDVIIEMMLKHPVPGEEMERFKALLPPKKPQRPFAFVFGHGLWNNLDLQATVDWLEAIHRNATSAAPWLQTYDRARGSQSSTRSSTSSNKVAAGGIWPRLFVTPNASGAKKPDEYLVSQGNKALTLFEQAMMAEGPKRGIDVLGTWNMTIQATKYDGV